MTRRIRCDCKLRGLPEAQRVKVEAWLFEEGLTYKEVVERCLREFGLKVSKSSVGRYYERVSADRFARVQREKQMALEPELSPSETYKVLLRRIAVLAWEEMDQPLEDINHKVVVRLVRVLIAARREKHQETRVWVERRKAENWLARECLRACLKIARAPAARNFSGSQASETEASPQQIATVEQTPAKVERAAARRVFAQKAVWLRFSSVEDPPGIFSFVAPRHPAFCPKTGAPGIFRKAPRHWRREMKKTAQVSYLPIWKDGPERRVGGTPTMATETVAVPKIGIGVKRETHHLTPTLSPHFVAEREKSTRTVFSCGVERQRFAGCKSAIQRVENLRYEAAAGESKAAFLRAEFVGGLKV